MPSAANVKLDKQINSDTAIPDCSSNTVSPLRQAITIIEHKIRNLEKRKAKLESYRQLESSGKDLNQDQKTAIAKYEEVVQTLDFARDLCKQFLGIATVSEKEAKKQARKDVSAKSHSELAKIREVLLVQDALNQMGQDNIRDDFLLGQNGAANLTESDLKLLDDLYPVVTPKHEPGDPTAFGNQVQAAAEHLLAVVDGKQKEVFDGSYNQIKEVIGKIHESGYFDQALVVGFESVDLVEADHNCEIPEQLERINEEMCVIEPVPVEPVRPPLPMPVEMPIEQIQQQPEQQMYYQQPPRPISEVLGTGSFFFLQDSELDTPDTLASQTFTNTSFVQAPPPPIPLPPNFQTFPQPGGNINIVPPGNGVNEEMPQSVVPNNVQQLQPTQDEPQKIRGQPPQPNNQMYYQNNHSNSSNYNNRPRQQRNGPRTTGNRHQ